MTTPKTRSPRRSGLEIVRDWRGEPIAPEQPVRMQLELDTERLAITVEAPFHDDPPPPVAPGSCDGLWNHEVVELFLLGDDDHYLEIELGPWDHYFVLALEGPRNIVDAGRSIDFEANRGRTGWTGRAEIPADWVPGPVGLGNAYAIHGIGPARRYRALHPVPGEAPDFHRLECFGPIGL